MVLSPQELERITGIAGAGKAHFGRRSDSRKSGRIAVVGRGVLCRQEGENRTANNVRIREVSNDGASWLSIERDAPLVGESVMIGLEPRGAKEVDVIDPKRPIWVSCEVIRRQSAGEGRVIVGVIFVAKANAPDLRRYETPKKAEPVAVTRVFSPRTGEIEQPQQIEQNEPKPKKAAAAKPAKAASSRVFTESSEGKARESDQEELERLRKAILG